VRNVEGSAGSRYNPLVHGDENSKQFLINEENKTNKMHKLIIGLIYYCSITPTCFGPLIEAIIRESKILECYKAFMAMCVNIAGESSGRAAIHQTRPLLSPAILTHIAIKAL
jgi:hypothetical protein